MASMYECINFVVQGPARYIASQERWVLPSGDLLRGLQTRLTRVGMGCVTGDSSVALFTQVSFESAVAVHFRLLWPPLQTCRDQLHNITRDCKCREQRRCKLGKLSHSFWDAAKKVNMLARVLRSLT